MLHDDEKEYASGNVTGASVTVSGTIDGSSAIATVKWTYDLVTTNEDGTENRESGKTATKEVTVR